MASAAGAGILSHLTDASARDAYVNYVKEGIIRDEVLAAASYGSIRTMALFHNLQNPLWKQQKFDVKEFVDYVPKALEIYADTLGRLVMASNTSSPSENSDSKDDASEQAETTAPNAKQQDGPFQLLFDQRENTWKATAKKDPDSLAGRLARMTTDRMFDEHYLGAELFKWVNATKQMASVEYVAGTSNIQQSALISAQIDYVLDEKDEFAASDENVPVAAQMEVLYELKQTYRPVVIGKEKPKVSTAEQAEGSTLDALTSTPSPSSETESTMATTTEVKAAEDPSKALPNDPSPANTAVTTPNDVETSSTLVETAEERGTIAVTDATKEASPTSVSATTSVDPLPTRDTSTDTPSSFGETESTKATATEAKTAEDLSKAHPNDPSPANAAVNVTTPNAVEASSTLETPDKGGTVAETKATDEASPTSVSATSSVGPASNAEDDDITETNFVVATLEGWMQGGPDQNQLRWKISQVRDAYEFR